jgi:hypothetical protein
MLRWRRITFETQGVREAAAAAGGAARDASAALAAASTQASCRR